ncbi:MAG: hypothetical protein HN348_09875, partial [Proteobacteria bacterium]|nr:hypothetical protein [Pseudomonadota bacterium]
MAQDLERIRRFIKTLMWRERTLILARILLHGGLLLLGALALAVLAALMRWDRSLAMVLLVGLVGLGTWALVVVPLILRWRASGDPLRQARLVEALTPELRGRLITAVERFGGPVGQESPAMLGLVAHRAAASVATVKPSRVHSGRRIALLFAVTLLTGFIAVPAGLLTPSGIKGTWRWWQAGFFAHAAANVEVPIIDAQQARVGDLLLRYTYPDYTGLEPREVPNSTGDVRGLPGTRVHVVARSAEQVEAAALVAYDEPALDAEVDEEGRSISGSFTVQEDDGKYHLVLYQESEPVPSREFEIIVEPDLVPEVMLDSDDDVLELAADQSFSLQWAAKDDYGIRVAEVRIDGREIGETLAMPNARQAEVQGELYTQPRELGLSPGDRVRLSIVAWDNDTYSGSKAGESRSIELVILGMRGLDERAAERQEALRDVMLLALADFLEEPWPPGETSGELASWGEVVGNRFEPLEDLVEEIWQGFQADSLEATVSRRVLQSARELIRYTQVAFVPGSLDRPKDAAYLVVGELRDETVMVLEEGILALDRALRMRALREVAERAEMVESVAELLEELLAEENPDVQELLARLDQLERMFEVLVEHASALDDVGLREFINSRQNEIQSLMDEIRKAIAAGKLDEAKELMERLANQLHELSEGIRSTIEQMQSEGDQNMQRAQSLTEELERLEQEQRQLQAQVQQIREDGDEAAAQKAAALWEQVQEKVTEVMGKSNQYSSGLEEADRSFFEQQRAKQAVEETKILDGAAQARDLWGAMDAAEVTKAAWGAAQMGLSIERRRRNKLDGPSEAELDDIQQRLAAIQRLLDKLNQLSSGTDTQTAQEASQKRQQQENLQRELQQTREQAQELMRKFPVTPRGMNEALEKADERMQQAGSDLGRGQPMAAEGSQGVAAERIKEAREALEKAMDQARKQSLSLGGGQKCKSGSGEGRGDSREQQRPESFRLPHAEDFLTPEE